MTKSNDLSLKARFTKWLSGESSPLDDELEAIAGGEDKVGRDMLSFEAAELEEEKLEQRRDKLLMGEMLENRRMRQWANTKGAKWLRAGYRITAFVVCAAIIFFLMSTVVALPPFGAEDNPYNNEVSQRYIEQGIPETGAVNFVAGMILDYRAFDTFGESTVLFVASCGVIFLMKLGDHAPGKPSKAMLEAEYDDRHHEPKNDGVLQFAAKYLTPIILLFGIYIVLNGHLSPGGGFSGGAVMGAGLILYLTAFGFEKTKRFFTYKMTRWISVLPLLCYAGMKSYSFFTGANHIPGGVPLGTPGAILSSGFILPLNICVGLIVMCTMYTFYALFRKGGM